MVQQNGSFTRKCCLDICSYRMLHQAKHVTKCYTSLGATSVYRPQHNLATLMTSCDSRKHVTNIKKDKKTYWSSAAVACPLKRFHMLRVQKRSSAYHYCNVWLLPYLLPSCQLWPVWPFSSDAFLSAELLLAGCFFVFRTIVWKL